MLAETLEHGQRQGERAGSAAAAESSRARNASSDRLVSVTRLVPLVDPHPTLAGGTASVVYQIYPRSFADSDGDGIGDLPRHHRHVWTTSPSSASTCSGCRRSTPRRRTTTATTSATTSDIDPVFGTLADFDELLAGVHERGMKLVMDLVVNHTSDEHPWFVESRSVADNPKRDWYWWRPPRPARAGRARRRADQLGVVLLRPGLGARRGDRRVLPAPVLPQAARPQLGEPARSARRSTR